MNIFKGMGKPHIRISSCLFPPSVLPQNTKINNAFDNLDFTNSNKEGPIQKDCPLGKTTSLPY